ncbi:TPA: outer membrane lipid asymmetry maintenance protein MlaD, partial [Aeromonas hydrophila]
VLEDLIGKFLYSQSSDTKSDSK